jgi:pimeloyl-ACP methyl ester carboxylesterase
MWGPSEFTCNGVLASWDRTAELGGIAVPTLIISGEFDEADRSCQEELQRGIEGSRLHIVKDASHLAHLEQTEEYVDVVREFLLGTEVST